MISISKKIIIPILLIAIITFQPAFANTSIPSTPEGLFVVLAKQAHIQTISKNHYHLTLMNINPEVIGFTNRPYRLSKQIELQKFIQLWRSGTFKQSAPNGVLVAVRLLKNAKLTKPKTTSYSITLTKPSYDKKTHHLSFNFSLLKGPQQKMPNMQYTTYVALFIDSACFSCWGS